MSLDVLARPNVEGLWAYSGMPCQAPPRLPESRIDPGIQVDPGPTRDPRSIVPPAKNPDPDMAINPETAPPSHSEQSEKRGKEKAGRLPREGQAGSEGEGAKGPGIPLPK